MADTEHRYYATKWKPTGSGRPGDNGADFILYEFDSEEARDQWAKLPYRQTITREMRQAHFADYEAKKMY